MKALGGRGVKLYSPKISSLVEVSGQHPTHSTFKNYVLALLVQVTVTVFSQNFKTITPLRWVMPHYLKNIKYNSSSKDTKI